MLPKIHRLTKKKDFDLVFRDGKSAKVGFLIIKTLKNNLSESRIGFVVSKKVSPKATVRNKIKRRLRRLMAQELQRIKKSSDIVIIVLPAAQEKTFQETKHTLNTLFNRL